MKRWYHLREYISAIIPYIGTNLGDELQGLVNIDIIPLSNSIEGVYILYMQDLKIQIS